MAEPTPNVLSVEERSQIIETFLKCLKQLGTVPEADSLSIDKGTMSINRDLVDTSPDTFWGVSLEFPYLDEVRALDGMPEIIDECVEVEFGRYSNDGDQVDQFPFKKADGIRWVLDEAGLNASDILQLDTVLSIMGSV